MLLRFPYHWRGGNSARIPLLGPASAVLSGRRTIYRGRFGMAGSKARVPSGPTGKVMFYNILFARAVQTNRQSVDGETDRLEISTGCT